MNKQREGAASLIVKLESQTMKRRMAPANDKNEKKKTKTTKIVAKIVKDTPDDEFTPKPPRKLKGKIFRLKTGRRRGVAIEMSKREQVAMYLLENAQGFTYRDVALQHRVSLGSIANVKKRLERANLLPMQADHSLPSVDAIKDALKRIKHCGGAKRKIGTVAHAEFVSEFVRKVTDLHEKVFLEDLRELFHLRFGVVVSIGTMRRFASTLQLGVSLHTEEGREKRRRIVAGSELGIDIDADASSDSFSISEHAWTSLSMGASSAAEEMSDSSCNWCTA